MMVGINAGYVINELFKFPSSKKIINFESKLPKDFKKILDLLNKLSH